MPIISSTAGRRVALTVVSVAYLFASHDAAAGGAMLRLVWLALGLSLAVLLAEASVASRLGWPIVKRQGRA